MMGFAAEIQFGSDMSRISLPLMMAPDFTHCGGVRVAQHDATELEFGHRKLRYDFRSSEFRYV
jgi:hypothetical protein